MSILHEIAPNFTYSQKIVFFKYTLERFGPTASILSISWQEHVKEHTSSFLPVVSRLCFFTLP